MSDMKKDNVELSDEIREDEHLNSSNISLSNQVLNMNLIDLLTFFKYCCIG